MLLALPIFCPNYAQIMLVFQIMPQFLNFIFSLCKMSETSPENESRSRSKTFLVSKAHLLFTVLCFLCLKATVSGYVCWFWYGL